jgi:putative selenium metabolism protein SsnA
MLIKNAVIVTWGKPNQILLNHAVRIVGTTIQDIGLQKELLEKYPEEDLVDARGQFLMPGLICAHTHFYGAFSRGMAIHGNPPADFPEILQKLWWPLDQSLLKEDVKYSALVCLVDAIKHGTTTLFDHHASPNFIEGSLDTIESAFIQTGVRGVVCYEITDRGGVEKAEQGIAENLRMISKVRQNDSATTLVKATFGMHASLTISDETMQKSRKSMPERTGMHIHVAEHPVDEYDSLQKCGVRVIDRLDQHGLLGSDSIIVHGVHMDMSEVQKLAETKTWLSHQPRSNMNNAVGMADIDSILRMGVKVCLGNDGFSNAMWDEWRTGYLAHKLWNRDPRKMNGSTMVEMAVYNNAELTSHFFGGQRIGVVEVGAKADLILADYEPITEVTAGNLAWHILFGFRDSNVTMTMVNGKILMKDRILVDLDEIEIAHKSVELSKAVWKRYENQF